MKHADARFSAKGGAAKPAAGGEGEDYNAGAEQQTQDGAAMAQEHGPATQINIEHDHEGGRHHVNAVHPDGHEHDSEHGSAGEAHQYAADCAGAGMGGGM
jgi:hypothetical protein